MFDTLSSQPVKLDSKENSTPPKLSKAMNRMQFLLSKQKEKITSLASLTPEETNWTIGVLIIKDK